MTTKENIMRTALSLFARDGYEAVSVGDIAGALTLTKAALYKHFKNKRDIFDSLVQRMCEYDHDRSKRISVPGSFFENMPDEYKNTEIEKVCAYMFTNFIFWTSDAFASYFRKMLSIERRRCAEMEALYQRFLGFEQLEYIKTLLTEYPPLRDRPELAESLALDLYSPFYMLIDIYDAHENKKMAVKLLTAHLEAFISGLERY